MNFKILVIFILFIIQLIGNNSFTLLSLNKGIIRRISFSKLNIVNEIVTQNDFDLLTISNSTNVITNLPMVIDFQKSKCAPCQKVAPKYHNLSVKYKDKVKFYKIDADSSKEALTMFKSNGIRSVPTFQLWLNGNRLESFTGANLDDLEDAINDVLNGKEK